ncbi:hypothetical protein [Paenibacillus apiarius]|uniref:Uncharacterized protein n=1 Tax=Paenibacillus apiarius TaxID=46240 RepID=A0ABT4DZA2_9BACL|nr:hypothetical protein [Paenibacillus apiarius]MCY9517846.1 hypothetical protein [Paenibacillus apiarius]MCY9522689.1 hypothetical protein [Paenibacillus apiarius]MCY9555374.1 hypothetical protein [Paenibacillus apiarius]MCY9561254.1 hypothetical protein [Paenibacillus apiarius]MCY9686553.1 hypothetical protein [Paenibacillus apiarius]
MLQYTINLFGNSIECELNVTNGKLEIEISDDKQEALKNYLARVLLRYGYLEDREALSFHDLISRAIEVEKNLGGPNK